MTARSLLQQAKKLKPKQRARLAEAIWESVEAAWTDPEMPEWHKRELDRRIEEHKRNPDDVLTLPELKRKLDQATSRHKAAR